MESFVLSGVALSLLSGIFSSALFLIILSLLKPRLKIGRKIACEKEGDHAKGYYFKVINKSCIFKVFDIRARVFACENQPSPNGDDVIMNEITLKKPEHWVLSQMRLRHVWQDFIHGSNRLRHSSNYAFQFCTFVDLESILLEKKYITIEVIARHSFTGFSVVKMKQYKHINDIRNGSFLSGNSCRIE